MKVGNVICVRDKFATLSGTCHGLCRKVGVIEFGLIARGASWPTGDPWSRTFYDWGRQLLGCRRLCGGTTSTLRPSQGRMFDRSWPSAFDRWQNLTGHIAYKTFDRLPVKYPVPFKKNLDDADNLWFKINQSIKVALKNVASWNKLEIFNYDVSCLKYVRSNYEKKRTLRHGPNLTLVWSILLLTGYTTMVLKLKPIIFFKNISKCFFKKTTASVIILFWLREVGLQI